MGKWKIVGLVTVLLVLAAFGVLASFLQAQLFVHHPPGQREPIDASPADYGLAYQDVTLATEDGYDLAGWYLPSQNRAAVILLHGYKNDRSGMLYAADMLARHGYGVLMLDLRAHGASEGELISFGWREVYDAEAAFQYLLGQADVDAGRIGMLGRSMGGVVALLYAADNPEIQAVVSESAFPSLEDEVPVAVESTGLPSALFAPLVQGFAEREIGFEARDVSALERIGAISPRPVFLIQGGADTIVPPDSGQRLYDAAGEPRELWFEPDLGHRGLGVERAEEYEARVVAFFDRYLLGD